MIIQGGIKPITAVVSFVWEHRLVVLMVAALEGVAWAVHVYFPETELSSLSAGAVGLLATIVGIFLAFRFNEAYARWWEARILWGGVVNNSRTFARQVTTWRISDPSYLYIHPLPPSDASLRASGALAACSRPYGPRLLSGPAGWTSPPRAPRQRSPRPRPPSGSFRAGGIKTSSWLGFGKG